MLNGCMIALVLPVSGERFHVATALVKKKHFLVGYARRLRPPYLFYPMWPYQWFFHLWRKRKSRWKKTMMKDRHSKLAAKQFVSTAWPDFVSEPNVERDQLIVPNYGLPCGCSERFKHWLSSSYFQSLDEKDTRFTEMEFNFTGYHPNIHLFLNLRQIVKGNIYSDNSVASFIKSRSLFCKNLFLKGI